MTDIRAVSDDDDAGMVLPQTIKASTPLMIF
jgi:hypothetical protein